MMHAARLWWLVALGVSACGAPNAGDEGADAPPPVGGRTVEAIEIVREGGIAGRRTVAVLRLEGPQWIYVEGRACPPAVPCPRRDSIAGALPRDTVRAIFASLPIAEFFALRGDYGRTPGAADMYEYVVTVRAADRARTVRADDQTLPPAAQRVVEAVFERLDRALGRR